MSTDRVDTQHTEANAVAVAEKPAVDLNDMSAIGAALCSMFTALDTNRDMIGSMLKSLKESAKSQDGLNHEVTDLKYERFPDKLPKDPKEATHLIDKVNADNARVNVVRGNIESRILTFRQKAKVDMTRAQAGISTGQTFAAQDTGLVKAEANIFKYILSITKRTH